MYIVSARGNILNLWDWEHRKLIRSFGEHKEQIRTILMSYNNKHIFSGSDDSSIQVWEFSHFLSPYQNVNYKINSLIDYFTKKYNMRKNEPILEDCIKNEFEKQADYEIRISKAKKIYKNDMIKFNNSHTKDISLHLANTLKIVYGMPRIIGDIMYNAEDEYFNIKIKFDNKAGAYNLLLDIPIKIASDFKKIIKKINIIPTFNKKNNTLSISSIKFLYQGKEFKARSK